MPANPPSSSSKSSSHDQAYEPTLLLAPDERHALQALAQQGAWCRKVGNLWIVVARHKDVSLRVASFNDAVHGVLLRHKWIAGDESKSAYFITQAGRKVLKLRP
jgi:hypothetical protein